MLIRKVPIETGVEEMSSGHLLESPISFIVQYSIHCNTRICDVLIQSVLHSCMISTDINMNETIPVVPPNCGSWKGHSTQMTIV